MKCPHCNYKSGWDNENLKEIKGEKGDFYYVSNEIKMIQERYMDTNKCKLVGCPACMKIFMN